MTLEPDELAGIVDLFGLLSRAALVDGVREIAFRRDEPFDESETEDAIDEAIDSFVLIQFEHEGESVVVAGPAAFPTLPSGAEDLPHILDVERRSVDRSILADPIRERLELAAVDVTDPDRATELLDVTYDAEAWTDVDLEDVRERLERIAPESPG